MDQYSQIANWYDMLYHKGCPEDLEEIDNALSHIKSGKILEIGCGTGRVLYHLLKQGFEIIGVDNSRRMLEIAKNKVDKLDALTPKNARFIHGCFPEIQLQSSFDAIIAPFNVLNEVIHEYQLYQILLRIFEYLSVGGSFVAHIVYSPQNG